MEFYSPWYAFFASLNEIHAVYFIEYLGHINEVPNTGHKRKLNAMKSIVSTIASSLVFSLVSLAYAQAPAPAGVPGGIVPVAPVALAFSGDSEFAEVLGANLPFWKANTSRVGDQSTYGALLSTPNGDLVLSCLKSNDVLKYCSLKSASIFSTGLKKIELATVFGWFANAPVASPQASGPVLFDLPETSTFIKVLATNLPGLYKQPTRIGTTVYVGALVPSGGGTIALYCSTNTPFNLFGKQVTKKSTSCSLDAAPKYTDGMSSIDLATVFGWFAIPEATP